MADTAMILLVGALLGFVVCLVFGPHQPLRRPIKIRRGPSWIEFGKWVEENRLLREKVARLEKPTIYSSKCTWPLHDSGPTLEDCKAKFDNASPWAMAARRIAAAKDPQHWEIQLLDDGFKEVAMLKGDYLRALLRDAKPHVWGRLTKTDVSGPVPKTTHSLITYPPSTPEWVVEAVKVGLK